MSGFAEVDFLVFFFFFLPGEVGTGKMMGKVMGFGKWGAVPGQEWLGCEG